MGNGKERILNPNASVLGLCFGRWMEVCLQIGSLSPPRVCMWLSLSIGNILNIIIIIGKRGRGGGDPQHPQNSKIPTYT